MGGVLLVFEGVEPGVRGGTRRALVGYRSGVQPRVQVIRPLTRPGLPAAFGSARTFVSGDQLTWKLLCAFCLAVYVCSIVFLPKYFRLWSPSAGIKTSTIVSWGYSFFVFSHSRFTRGFVFVRSPWDCTSRSKGFVRCQESGFCVR